VLTLLLLLIHPSALIPHPFYTTLPLLLCIRYYSDYSKTAATNVVLFLFLFRRFYRKRFTVVKNRISLALVALLFFAITLPAFVFAQQGRQAPPIRKTPVEPSGITSPRGRTNRARAMSNLSAEIEQDFSEALTVIQDNYVDGNRLNYNDVFKSSIIGMLRTLDPHSNYYDPQEFEELRADQRSEYYGIGAQIGTQTRGDDTETYIVTTFEGTPAARAGLRFGDTIREVNGESMRGKTTSEVRDKIRGPRGTKVRLAIEHAATGRVENVEITRDAVSQPSVPDAYMIRPGVGYIDMTRGFNFDTADELQSRLEQLHRKGMTSLVLDLRENPGGFLEEAVRVADQFLQRDQIILTQKGRNDQKVYRATNEAGPPDQTPLVILINEDTASASEIVSGAMQDHDRALIVGETSFGKGLVQGIWPLEYGAGLTLTSAKYYTPSGRLIQRDYSNEGFYDYYTQGGSLRSEQQQQAANQRPAGPESHTDLGRSVYGGGGITPDEAVKPRSINNVQVKLRDPIFFFTRELVNGRIPGLDAYKAQSAIEFNHQLQDSEYAINDAVYKAFQSFVARDSSWAQLAPYVERNRQYIEVQIRFNIITAAYGTVVANHVLLDDDQQVAKAIEMLPRARELAMRSLSRRAQP